MRSTPEKGMMQRCLSKYYCIVRLEDGSTLMCIQCSELLSYQELHVLLLKQIEAQEARMQDFMHEASKPLARHKNDRDLENSLKDVLRDGDPMLQYIMDKKRERGDLGPEKPIYKGKFPPNRFNIRPGYRWDGVDRSNGYEKKYFEQQSKRKAQEEEAYKWSTEDL
ncbi:hypothetical protein evm_011190 [Chilo suppressalis]|nr:hypothetical protein evm_011190 [Chilo suppressalis]